MSYYIWIIVNFIFILFVTIYVWLARPLESYSIIAGLFIAQIAVILFALNVNNFFLIQVIKRSNIKKVKTSLAKLLRKLMKVHIKIAIISTTLILIHASIMLFTEGRLIGYLHIKLIAGYIAIILLAVNLYAGYLRHYRASGFRRKFHLYMALTFTVAFIIHILIPVS